MPLIHKPSFMADLEAGEEERNPIFFALILQMISMTLIHVRSLWVIVLISSYQSLTFQYPQRTSEHARIDVCEEQMPLPTVMQSDWSWTCVLSSTSLNPSDGRKLTDIGFSCLLSTINEVILDWKQQRLERRSISQFAWECTVKM